MSEMGEVIGPARARAAKVGRKASISVYIVEANERSLMRVRISREGELLFSGFERE